MLKVCYKHTNGSIAGVLPGLLKSTQLGIRGISSKNVGEA